MQPFIKILKQSQQRYHEAWIRYTCVIVHKEKRWINGEIETKEVKKIGKGKTKDRITQEKEWMQMIRIDYYR